MSLGTGGPLPFLIGDVGRPALPSFPARRSSDLDHVNDRRVSRGFRASNTIEVRVDDLPQLGRIIDAAVQSGATTDRKSTRLNSSHLVISYAVFCLTTK